MIFADFFINKYPKSILVRYAGSTLNVSGDKGPEIEIKRKVIKVLMEK